MQIIVPWWVILAIVVGIEYCLLAAIYYDDFRCCNCGGYGHRASHCPLGKGMR